MQRDRTPTGLDRRSILVAGCGAFIGLGGVSAAALGQSAPIGAVDEVRGEASAELQGKHRELKKQSEIFVGDLLATGNNGRLVLKLGPATTIKLGAAARLRIDRYLAETGGEFELVGGHIQFERHGKPAADGITFRSAYGLMAVRGTRFYAGPNRGQFAVLVGEGLLEVTAGGLAVLVHPQQGIDIKAPGQRPSTPRPWQTGRIREMQANFL